MQFLIDADMVAINTHFECGGTYYGDVNKSRIDFVCASSNAFPGKIKSCRVLNKEGDKLQHTQTHTRKDHRPVETELQLAPQYNEQQPENKRFDGPISMRGILQGFRVNEFCESVEEWATDNMDSWFEAMKTGSTENMWKHINQGIRLLALSIYSVESSKNQNLVHLIAKNHSGH